MAGIRAGSSRPPRWVPTLSRCLAADSDDPAAPTTGGGWPLIEGWAKASLSPKGARLWQTLRHKSACLSCAWGTGGQNGGFVDELGEPLQRCLKSVEAIQAELQPAVPEGVFGTRSIAELQELSSLEADRLGRLAHPLILREGRGHYERLGWDDVFEIAEAALRRPPERFASHSSGRSSNEAAWLLQLMPRALGSNNLADCSDLCHAPSTVGLNEVFGSGTSMVSLESLRQADCVVLVGSKAPANHPRLMNELIRLRERGGSVIVINPVLEVGLLRFGSPAFPIRSMLGGSGIASLFLQPVPSSDTAVFLGIQKALLESGAFAWEFLQAHTEGWEAVVERLRGTGWEAITGCCGISREELEHVAAVIARTVPSYAPIAEIDATREEFSVQGRVFLELTFPTPSGRARMEITPVPALELPGPAHFGGLAPGETGLVLALITARSYGQHNTVVFREGDAYRAMPHRRTILMSRADLRWAGLEAHQRVTVQGEAGALEDIEIIPGAIREGAALMFYPEVNAILLADIDPRSGTPAFKRAPVLVRGSAQP